MYAKEKEIVTEEFILREDTYNLRRGGYGGFDYINKNPHLHSRVFKNPMIHRKTVSYKRSEIQFSIL